VLTFLENWTLSGALRCALNPGVPFKGRDLDHVRKVLRARLRALGDLDVSKPAGFGAWRSAPSSGPRGVMVSGRTLEPPSIRFRCRRLVRSSSSLGAHGSVAHGGERAFDDVGRAQMLPVLGREVAEGEQRIAILGQHSTALWYLCISRNSI
jgi:hypothetical protein